MTRTAEHLRLTAEELTVAIARNVPDASGRYDWVTKTRVLEEARAACETLARIAEMDPLYLTEEVRVILDGGGA